MAASVPDQESAPRLPGEAVVVRGGLMDRERTIANAQAAFRDPEVGLYGLSVWSVAGLSAADIVRLARSQDTDDDKYLPHAQMRQSTVRQLTDCRFGFVEDSPEGHYLLTLPTPPADTDWDALEQAFAAPEPTPPREEA